MRQPLLRKRVLTSSAANKFEQGGLSGPPLKPYALATLRTLRGLLPASIPLIGCGGIASGADALEYARAGASAVQLYTSFGYGGPGVCRQVKDELTALLRQQGTTWAQVVRESVAQHSLKDAPKEKEAEVAREPSVPLLLEEAEELKRLVDELGARMEKGAEEGVSIVGDAQYVAVTPSPIDS